MSAPQVSLTDKYENDSGKVFISGAQAFVKLVLLQQQLDQKNNLNTTGFVSGYRGSPMGMIDSNFWKESKRLDSAQITFESGINEDLAATAIWGTQQIEQFGESKFDGVFGLWYGKGPGVDRSGDAFRHGNYAGTHKNGGVLVAYGDDHPGKSSTVVNQSEHTVASFLIPSLYPSNVEEIIEFGLLGWSMSRYTGSWVGLKCINETVEQTQTVDLDHCVIPPLLPSTEKNDVNIKPNWVAPIMQEQKVKRDRMPLINEFVRQNKIDKSFLSKSGKLGIVVAGKTYLDLKQSFKLMGMKEDQLEKLGIGIYKVGCIWPLEPKGIAEFSQGFDELLFIEEKTAMVEPQAKDILYGEVDAPKITGKFDSDGSSQFALDIQIEPKKIAEVVLSKLSKFGVDTKEIESKVFGSKPLFSDAGSQPASTKVRAPYFCSGCPHNTSTQLPEGSKALAGIGCHVMAMFNRKDVFSPTQMGGEGMNWVGAANFVETEHMFQNLGDGTYFHSGLLAIRGAIASGVNLTYKLLYNDAVAMTGGQPVDGTLTLGNMTNQLIAEGIKDLVIVSDNPDVIKSLPDIPKSIKVYHREKLDWVQKEMREVKGVSAIIYEQTCAAEKRRRRKKGTMENPAKRMFIHEDVCENCGDCSVQSTCVSIQQVDTKLGVKRRIEQSGCNKDYSCVNGFCPSFVSVENSDVKKQQGEVFDYSIINEVPQPKIQTIEDEYSVMIAGIGGTGVITIGAVLGMAAHIEGKGCSIYDMTGLSQKNGAVFSHLKLAKSSASLGSQKIGESEADLILGFDLVASLMGDSLPTFSSEKTHFIGNSNISPTYQFQFDRDVTFKNNQELTTIQHKSKGLDTMDTTGMSLKYFGDAIAANMMLLGYAYQLGAIPVSEASIMEAIKLNGVAIKLNQDAFTMGRILAFKRGEVASEKPKEVKSVTDMSLTELVEFNKDRLTKYQDENYAETYARKVAEFKEAEANMSQISGFKLTHSFAIQLAKLMTYKDEYEIARLYSLPEFKQRLDKEFNAGYKLKLNLAPPLLASKDTHTKKPKKMEFGAWIFPALKLLTKFKFLRKSALNPFGFTVERKMERKLISDYQQLSSELLEMLSVNNIDEVNEALNLASEIRGFGHVKEQSIHSYYRNVKVALNKVDAASNNVSKLEIKEAS